MGTPTQHTQYHLATGLRAGVGQLSSPPHDLCTPRLLPPGFTVRNQGSSLSTSWPSPGIQQSPGPEHLLSECLCPPPSPNTARSQDTVPCPLDGGPQQPPPPLPRQPLILPNGSLDQVRISQAGRQTARTWLASKPFAGDRRPTEGGRRLWGPGGSELLDQCYPQAGACAGSGASRHSKAFRRSSRACVITRISHMSQRGCWAVGDELVWSRPIPRGSPRASLPAEPAWTYEHQGGL